ncbi:hypothetical protein [Stappia sp.]|uniref:hypothetical protein n=1 Tax=Stappia sp. TaxID=1870903 RepID=UPI003C7AF580
MLQRHMHSGFLAASILAMLSVAAVGQTPGGEPFEPVFVDSLKCNASGTKGCTVHRTVNVSAGPDRVFVPDSLKFREDSRSGGGTIYVQINPGEMIDVPVTVSGVVYNLKMPRTASVVLHAESGSGTGNYNRGAWINGYVEGRTIEVER